MANVTRVKVELKKKYNDPDKNFRDLHQEFKRCVSNSGIMNEYRNKEFYVSKSEKKRKKKNEQIKKMKMSNLEKQILGGENVKASAGLIKKVMSNINKNKAESRRRNKYRQEE